MLKIGLKFASNHPLLSRTNGGTHFWIADEARSHIGAIFAKFSLVYSFPGFA
ncbi:hypothetical protein QUA49_26730 [Microcoleus sp. N9_B1]